MFEPKHRGCAGQVVGSFGPARLDRGHVMVEPEWRGRRKRRRGLDAARLLESGEVDRVWPFVGLS